jgi:L-threonylcarbamoyladenylate synthase
VPILDGFLETSVQKAVTLLKDGEVVAFPTETVYGLGADAFNPCAVAKIFETKKRPSFDPLIVHVGEGAWVEEIACSVPPDAHALIERFWPGPLTIILPKKPVVPDIVTAGLPTVAVRMPSHPVALRLIRALGHPIAAPSANPFGYMSPTNASHVMDMFKGRLPLILDGGKSVFGIESTIVSVTGAGVIIQRHGAVSLEDLACAVRLTGKRETTTVVEAPGQLPYHYAPHKPLRIIDSVHEIETELSSFLAFTKPAMPPRSKHLRVLSEKGDLREAAANFFSHLIELDRNDVEVIYAEKIPERGIGKAMMDRLKKAAKKYRYITH